MSKKEKFPKEAVEKWEKEETIPGKDPKKYRFIGGKERYFFSYGLNTEKGWSLDLFKKDVDSLKLFEYIDKNDLDNFKKLVEDGADIEVYNDEWNKCTPLNHACREEKVEFVKYLIEKGANVNSIGRMDMSCIFDALTTGNLELVKILVNNGADINHKVQGESLLSFALSHGFEYVKFFRDLGLSVTDIDNEGKTPLGRAIDYNRSTEIIKFLIDNGADVNRKESYENLDDGDNEMTPLIASIRNGDYNIANYLIEKGADISILDSYGKCAYDYLDKEDFYDFDPNILLPPKKDKKLFKTEECGICMDDIEKDDAVIIYPCCHVFCKGCIGYLNKCALCKGDIQDKICGL